MSGLHRTFSGEQVHVAHSYEYADATARANATGFVSTDLKKLALQLDDNSLWMLIGVEPTWKRVGGGEASEVGVDAVPFSVLAGANVQEVLQDIDDKMFNMPAGVLGHFAGDVIPAGVRALVRDGAEYNTADYPELFNVIGYTYGGSGGVFNVPDDRNLFDRGVPVGGVVGTEQADAIGSHRHSFSSGSQDAGSSYSGSQVQMGHDTTYYNSYTNNTGSTETRPKNRHYLPIIFY
ncbi:MAG: hypothetical protein CL942_14230 [Desulfovibrio sp.]|nr:hypothetical protein [Desulfovibrio sp.]|tara:strand:+ start:414 stop:1118 length:705 start_codon:yes stop_codon:yes gene_type:complete